MITSFISFFGDLLERAPRLHDVDFAVLVRADTTSRQPPPVTPRTRRRRRRAAIEAFAGLAVVGRRGCRCCRTYTECRRSRIGVGIYVPSRSFAHAIASLAVVICSFVSEMVPFAGRLDRVDRADGRIAAGHVDQAIAADRGADTSLRSSGRASTAASRSPDRSRGSSCRS